MGEFFLKVLLPRDTEAQVAAEHLIHLARERHGEDLTPMQVLKILYMAHGWMLALCGRPLFGDPVEAWTYGPVVPGVYHRYSRFGRNPINTGGGDRSAELDKQKVSVLGQALDRYRGFTGVELSDMTHRPGSPWARTRDLGLEVISNDVIQMHYRDLHARLTESAGP